MVKTHIQLGCKNTFKLQRTELFKQRILIDTEFYFEPPFTVSHYVSNTKFFCSYVFSVSIQ